MVRGIVKDTKDLIITQQTKEKKLLEWNQSLNRFYQPISNQRGTLI
jgi:hypothetical protein